MSIVRINSLGITDGTIVNGDISASAAIASTKLTGINDAKAWVNFNGTGTPAIRASFNVSSITDNGTGDYTVNFTTAFADINYATLLTASPNYGVAEACQNLNSLTAGLAESAPTTSNFRFTTRNSASSSYDPKYLSVLNLR